MPKPLLYTPVHQSYLLPGPTYRLGDPAAGRLLLEVDDERDEFLRNRRSACGLWQSDDDRIRRCEYLTDWFKAVVRRDQPSLLAGDSDLDKMVAAVQEDVVIMQRQRHASAVSARALYVNVSYPSSWCPPCVCGRTFMSIHAAVPNADRFDGHSRKTSADLLFQGDELVRFVWSLTPDNRLDRRSCRRSDGEQPLHESIHSSWESAERLFLRVERQVIAPIDEDTACFLIRIYRYAVEQLTPGVRSRIRSAILGMPKAVREYKGIVGSEPQILKLLS